MDSKQKMKRIKWKLILLITIIYHLSETLSSTVFSGGWCGNDVSSCNPPENGEFSRCDMCMCSNLNKFVNGIDSCSNNHILYACYISYRSIDDPAVVGCKVKLKTPWLIGFILGSCFICSLICLGIGIYSTSYCKSFKKINSYQIEEKQIEEAHDLEFTSSNRNNC